MLVPPLDKSAEDYQEERLRLIIKHVDCCISSSHGTGEHNP